MDLVCASPAMTKVRDLALQAAEVDSPVLLTGETGSGKEVLARFIHDNSNRASTGSFVPTNCSEFPESLIEDAFFGHLRGAFTGAERDEKGLVEEAHKGTLFLDELSSMSYAVQVKLLRVLENKEFRKVGSVNLERSDFRLICATNQDLNPLIRAGRFRMDLFYRVSSVLIRIPPLRERLADIPVMLQSFLEEKGLSRISISPAALELLLCYPWPGNVRELKGVVEYIMLHRHSIERAIEPQHLPLDRISCRRDDVIGTALTERVKCFRQMVLKYEISANNGDIRQVAQLLKTSTDTVYRIRRSAK